LPINNFYFLISKTLKYKYICNHIIHMRSSLSRGILDIVPILAIHYKIKELFSQTVSQNRFSSTSESAPAQDPEPELFLKEPESYQTSLE
jgi:hypothetical protein